MPKFIWAFIQKCISKNAVNLYLQGVAEMRLTEKAKIFIMPTPCQARKRRCNDHLEGEYFVGEIPTREALRNHMVDDMI